MKSLPSTSSALLLVDCQNDLLTEGGALYPAMLDSLQKNTVIANINAAIHTARTHKLPIVFTSMSFSENYAELGKEPYGILGSVKSSGAFVRSTWGAKVADDINIQDTDTIFLKNTMCAFKHTELEPWLREKGITQLVFGGLVTDLCLETSVRSAYDLGFDTLALTDCMASINHAAHLSTISDNLPLFSKPMTHENLAEALTQ